MTHAPAQMAAPVFIEFDDNRHLPELFGEHDKHLVQIEKALGVSLINRGNQVAINGPDDAVKLAFMALERLYERLSGGEPVEKGDVDAAMRMADAPKDLFGEQEAVIRTPRKTLAARTPNQSIYMDAMRNFDLTFGIGPAGTGKTYLAVCHGVSMLTSGAVDRIILSRPAVEAGERLGFLPGDMKEKVDPYLRPIYDALYDTLPADQVNRKIDNGEIEIAPLAFMRGRTLKNAFVLLDEAQNTTPAQMKMFLTRLGDNSRMVITGDMTQVDLPHTQKSGLRDALETLKGVDGIYTMRFQAVDVVRHALVARIVDAYDNRQREVGSDWDLDI
ncbi:PhoH family protein [Aestuariispira insulae]|nr:PhoH family protein [Aestuariispira insulae]